MVLSGQRDSVDSFIGWFLSSPLTCQRARILLEGSVRRGPSSAKVQDDIDAEDQVDGDVLRTTPLFSRLFLCLSRACLGKMIVLNVNGAKSGVFRTPVRVPASCHRSSRV